jgi:hypothetical protein
LVLKYSRSLVLQDKDMFSDHHPNEVDCLNTLIEVESIHGMTAVIEASLLRIYPQKFNGYDAYLDFSMRYDMNIRTVHLSSTGQKWRVITKTFESSPSGYFRGDISDSNPPRWIVGLELIKNS